MIDIKKISQSENKIVTVGSHPRIIQSILDFDYLAEKKEPSVAAIIASGRKGERYFFGKKEIIIPVVSSSKELSKEKKQKVTLALILVSGRRVRDASNDVLENFPNLFGSTVFAEGVPEQHALEIAKKYNKKNKFILGPASVGLLIPNSIKLGAIGGVDTTQITDSNLLEKGETAVFSASGGMTNELIRIVANTNHTVSFALAFGGERFPGVTPQDSFLAAQKDSNTKNIIYFGELGGQDEYDIAKLIKEKKVSKKVICYIAGVISDYFEQPPQFGHAKAMAQKHEETAVAKRKILKEVGAVVPDSFAEFVKEIEKLPGQSKKNSKSSTIAKDMANRKHALIASSISKDVESNPTILGEDLLELAHQNSFAKIVGSMFLGRKINSKKTEEFIDFSLKLLVDHGPYVSGALNSIVTSRAGKDLSASLAAGVLTIGPRFGGAINEAAKTWFTGVAEKKQPAELVEQFASEKKYISGIGHRKYRIDLPDPRVSEIISFTKSLKESPYTDFAKKIEKITVAKKGNLILNVDGAIASVLLDLLAEEENYTQEQLQKSIDTQVFNALFIASRSIGFLAHAIDQKRLDEGLLRLSEDDVADAKL